MADIYDYKSLLARARASLPAQTEKSERFEIPEAVGHVEGNKTIINNFNQICDVFQREPSHLLKYFQRELATPAQISGQRLILGRKITASLINIKIGQYARDFVLCSECKKPDTKLIKEDRVWVIRCTACGAKHPVKAKI
ncbi:TPA: translation initiation factor IF-2 subunit beta [archaeon]|nr:translation initiation factor IF-2 subunit beta [Candidatus Naiadarchaeales archaeon SRR2090153.bin1042]